MVEIRPEIHASVEPTHELIYENRYLRIKRQDQLASRDVLRYVLFDAAANVAPRDPEVSQSSAK